MKNMETPVIAPVQPLDFEMLTAFLAEAGLPANDLPEGLPHFFKAEIRDELAGTVGLEIYGRFALLRSLAVAEKFRNRQTGKKLYNAAVSHALENGVGKLFLITTTADRYFARLGFVIIGRETAPPEIRQTAQFRDICPSSATVMRLVLQARETG